MSDENNNNKIDEKNSSLVHELPDAPGPVNPEYNKTASITIFNGIYRQTDFNSLQKMSANPANVHILKSLDELLHRDERRKEDGFPKKIRLGKLVKPSREGKSKVIIVPTVVEEKFIHDTRLLRSGNATGGSGDGKEGDVIGEEPIHSTQQGSEPGSGGEGEAEHEIESTAYELGEILTEKFELPNLKDKGKKKSLTKYKYDLTDKNRGFGQFLDKKSTLKRIIETNLSLGNIIPEKDIDTNNLIVSPRDKVYRTLSKEKDYEAQAVVFFLRDYSGSMMGKPTDLVVSQHLFIYSWLMYQYQNNVMTRYILHDDKAREVEDFYSYYNTSVAGGTRVASGYKMINEIVEKESLVTDYNIYIFQGTDGEDWDAYGEEAVKEIKKILGYVNRIGITIAQSAYSTFSESVVEKYITKSGVLEKKSLIRMDSLQADSDQERIIEGIKKLVSQNGAN